MPERPSPRRLLAATALAVAGLTVAAPAALAQTDQVPAPEEPAPPPQEPGWEERWDGSSFDTPFAEPGHTVRVQPFGVSGTLRYERQGPADQIVQAEIRIVDDPEVEGAPGEGCTLPAPVVIPGSYDPDPVAEMPFAAELGQVTCNGAYLLEVEASTDSAATYVLRQRFAVGMLPDAVTDLDVQLDEEARSAAVTFAPLPPEQLAPDAIGYVIERSGPADPDGTTGAFVDVGTLDLDDEPRFADDLAAAAGGAYTYRVRATRAGAQEPERSSVIDTETATITIGEPPEEEESPPTTERRRSTTRPGRSGRGGAVTRRSSPSRSATATTIDTGFEDTLDYGDRPPGSELPGDQPLAGQSVIQDEGEDPDLAAPVAGALVLLGWAGHIAYLNRLARQL